MKNNNAESDSGESDDELEEFCRLQFFQFDLSDPDNWPSLTTFRKHFLNALIASQHYYEDDNIDDFEALNVKSLVVKDGQFLFPRNYQEYNDKLARRFQINTPNIGLQLQDLIQNIIQNIVTKVTVTTFKDWIAMPPQIFYVKVLETAESDDVIDMSDELYDYIASALTVPVGSAGAERGFSVLFHSLDSRRSCLSIETIDNILKIRLNGLPITQFVCYKFVEGIIL
uniref:HAT C-terminal dimerisation domain-containing protein n=1 Tax=Panagrolaimus davidi TaxID=227884 RepID=A0A914QZ80_9BILA